jgi:hypothetical protein
LIRLVSVPIELEIRPPAATLSWNSIIGKAYQLQYLDALGAGSWINLRAPITATNLSTTVRDDTAATSAIMNPSIQRIYRALWNN